MDIKNKSLYADYKNFNFQVMAKNLKSPYVALFYDPKSFGPKIHELKYLCAEVQSVNDTAETEKILS